MKLTSILLTLLGHMTLIYLHRYHMSIVGVNILQFTGFMLLHAMWHYFTAKRVYIRI